MYFDQSEFNIRCEWGEQGVAVLAPISDVVIVVDVLSFCTSVEIAVQMGAVVYPYRGKADQAVKFATSSQAELAGQRRSTSRYSLSPASLLSIGPGTRLVLPSPNGASLTLAAHPTPVIAGCLRNAQAVAQAAMKLGRRIAVIPAGERWQSDMTLRAAFEDFIGAGAIISQLDGSLSPEAASAAAAFRAIGEDPGKYLSECSSGRELIERGFAEDVRLASLLDVSDCAPILMGDAFVRAEF